MTLADVERGRRKGATRSRSRVADTLPQPRALNDEVRDLMVRLTLLGLVYTREHDELASLLASDVHVQTSPSDTTVATVVDPKQEAARDRCRDAVAFLRRAAANVDGAIRAFGPEAVQPGRDDDSVVSRSTFDRAVHRRRHYEREEQLRDG